MIIKKSYTKKGLHLIFYKENEKDSKCSFLIEDEEDLTNKLLLSLRQKSRRVNDNEKSMFYASESIFDKIFSNNLKPYYTDIKNKKEKDDGSWAYNADGTWNEEAIKKKQIEMRQEQRNSPTDIYMRKYQEHNRRSFRPKKVSECSHGQTGQVVFFKSKDGTTHYGVGDSFVEAKKDLCTTLLKNEIDIKKEKKSATYNLAEKLKNAGIS